jgi:hypothetical protein
MRCTSKQQSTSTSNAIIVVPQRSYVRDDHGCGVWALTSKHRVLVYSGGANFSFEPRRNQNRPGAAFVQRSLCSKTNCAPHAASE